MSLLDDLTAREALRILQLDYDDLEPSDVIYRNQILDALDQLSDELQSVAWAVGVLDLTQKEAARTLDVDQSTISRRWKEALCQLQPLI